MAHLIKRKDSIPKSTSTISKWSDSISSQLNKVSAHINVQLIPTDQIIIDKCNPRQISLDEQDIEKNKELFSYLLSCEKETVDIDKCIKAFEHSKKKVADAISLSELAKSIGNKDNLINPIIVYHEKFKFYLIAGHRRYFAHKILGEQIIKANILESKPSKIENSVIQWKENEDREDLTVYEKITNVEHIISMLDPTLQNSLTSAKLASLINTGQTTSKLYLSVIKEKNSNALFKKALQNDYIRSLLIAYKIVNIKSKTEKTKILKDIIKNEKTGSINLKKSNKNTRDTSGKKHQVLNLSKVDNLKPMVSIVQTLIDSKILTKHKKDLEKIELKTKTDLLKAWKLIYSFFEQDK